MVGLLVETKLYRPRSRQGLVERPRLLQKDGAGLTLVSAPAGFGKTTLVSAWAAENAAWVSLEASDQEPVTFWTYVLTALERAAPGVAEGALAVLQSGTPPIETVLAVVLNELSVLPDQVDLVLDDYHLADGLEISRGMTYLLDHLPPQLHILISTRADPALPLARLRSRGELVEVRAADLRFTLDEVHAYLNDVTGLGLDAKAVATLEERTEGWIAALGLAALSLQGRSDAAGFIDGFAGDDRYVVDYLVDEVLDRQPAPVRRFLLETSVVDGLTGPLCDAVTGQPGGRAMLESLERRNLFVVPLDDRRQWYRYHHLFADVLRARLLAERSDITDLHRRAAQWYGETGDTVAAVRHSVAAGDVDHAADLIELAVPHLQRERREATILRWLDVIPDELVRRRPVLAIGFVGALMAGNQFQGVEQRIQDIERQLAGPVDALVVVDPQELDRLPGAIETYRAALCLIAGDPAGTIDHAADAIRLAVEGDDLTTSAASALSGLASWAGGDIEAAHRGYAAGAEGLERIGHIADVLGCSITLADLEITQGHLRQAQATFERALKLAGEEKLRGTSDMYVGLSQLAWERNDLGLAADYLRRSEDLDADLPQNPYRWRVAMARIREAEGDLDTALELLDAAIRVYVGDFSPTVRPLTAVRARLLIARGELVAAQEWADSLPIGDSYLHEYEHVTLARLMIAQHRDCAGLLERLRAATENGGRTGTLIEILVLQALAARDPAVLERALTIAEPEGYVRTFIAEGAPMMSLLSTLQRRRPDWAYPRTLLDRRTQVREPVAPQSLLDPLSDREIDVLRLLTSELDGPSIARELVVSLNTVRTHTKHIYTKLGVNSRRAAVRRAHQLGLLKITR
ncbi:LuxR C-terminal-related transcriptional regulator [Kribbella kalugense]|uniref:LuxR family maltose regulon positive regulatory protein n=1 Tax=Kribbella kalugense TaxID=2512221 RepID=A0A4R8A152_9ACTN|nr:LuxR C-terminal-related transcriptional regulator [Kribbella kalugense]TDW21820.1 LuxR family maltose regulon positive regulatory protein [Kribbella kalugense]